MQTEPRPHPDQGRTKVWPRGLCLGIFPGASGVQLHVQLGGWALLVALLGSDSGTPSLLGEVSAGASALSGPLSTSLPLRDPSRM